MPGPRRPPVIESSAGVRHELIRLTRRPSVAAGLARRARLVLWAATGVPLRQIGPRLGVSRTVVRDWRDRFRTLGLAGLQERPRSGRPRAFPPRWRGTTSIAPATCPSRRAAP